MSNAPSQEIIKKITFKALAGVPSQADVRDAIKAERNELPQKLCVVGFAKGTKITTNADTGEAYESLEGEFLAYVPTEPNKHFISATLYMPGIAADLIKGRLKPNETVEFALNIGTRLPKEGEKSPVGYIYTVSPLIKPTKSNPLLALAYQAQGIKDEPDSAEQPSAEDAAAALSEAAAAEAAEAAAAAKSSKKV